MQSHNIQSARSAAAAVAFRASETSAQAHESISLGRKKQMQDDILAICINHQRNGALDMSAQEIRRVLELQYQAQRGASTRVDMSSMTAPIARLVDACRLLRLDHKRVCSITGQNIHPLRVPMTQARLVA